MAYGSAPRITVKTMPKVAESFEAIGPRFAPAAVGSPLDGLGVVSVSHIYHRRCGHWRWITGDLCGPGSSLTSCNMFREANTGKGTGVGHWSWENLMISTCTECVLVSSLGSTECTQLLGGGLSGPRTVNCDDASCWVACPPGQ